MEVEKRIEPAMPVPRHMPDSELIAVNALRLAGGTISLTPCSAV